MKSGTAKRSQMAIKTPLTELRDAVVYTIASDTYQGYQEDTTRLTNRANLEVRHVTDVRMRAL